ncbi:MAG: lasso RiPP family leader peptide-containing protein [Dechloromonas sp.]|jgi:hypothetical protein|nr:lasso RiPP family leader peptide-containing protein [Candidatus Dechloromonas phosphoritropha]MBP8788387.1 lasso RiPP family leader peptide-containing protein [Azonexus sp.]
MTDFPFPKQKLKKPYASPKLVRHGDVRFLTQGGAGSSTEGAMMTAQRRKP